MFMQGLLGCLSATTEAPSGWPEAWGEPVRLADTCVFLIIMSYSSTSILFLVETHEIHCVLTGSGTARRWRLIFALGSSNLLQHFP